MKSELFVTLRVLFGLYLIWVGIKEINDVENLKRFIPNTLEIIEKNILQPGNMNYNLDSLRKNAKEILFLDYSLIIFSGLMVMFGLRVGKLFLTLSLLIDFIFIHNIIYYRDEKFLINASRLFTILGGTMYF
jgi:hypothetical protein